MLTLGSLLNAGSAPVFRLTPEANPFPKPLVSLLLLADVDMALALGFLGAGSIALNPLSPPPPRRGFFDGGASSGVLSLVCDCVAPGRLTLMRPGFERSTTLWNEDLESGFATDVVTGGASPSDSESE